MKARTLHSGIWVCVLVLLTDVASVYGRRQSRDLSVAGNRVRRRAGHHNETSNYRESSHGNPARHDKLEEEAKYSGSAAAPSDQLQSSTSADDLAAKMRNSSWPGKDYVSTKEPPLGFEKWMQFASENKCHMGSYKRIERDLQAFVNASVTGKITKDRIHAASKMFRTTTFVVTNGSVAQHGGDYGFGSNFLGIMKRFSHLLPDMTFVVNNMDEPRILPALPEIGDTDSIDARLNSSLCANASPSFQKHRQSHGFINNRNTGPSYDPPRELLPLFSQSKINECYRDITYPTLYGTNSRLSEEQQQQLIPWDQRIPKLYWRGSTTGGAFSISGQHRSSHRQRLVQYAKSKPTMDMAFTAIIQCNAETCLEMEKEYGVSDRVTEMDNFKHKFLMSLDGNTFVSRLPQFLSSASVNFRAGLFNEWFDEWIHDGEHYVQVELDYSDLEAKVKWAIENDDKARRIGLEARQFANTRLRVADMECYLFRLLLEYAAVCE